MSKRRILIFVLLVAFAMLAAIWLQGINPAASPILVSILIVAVFPIVAFAATTKPLWDFVENILDESNLQQMATRFYLYGRGGSGKTTLIKSWLGGEVRPEQATKYFAYYTAEKYVDLETKKRWRVVVSDYQGQSPSQNTLNASAKVIGPTSNRAVNAAFFIVDIAPRIEKGGQPLATPELVEWLSTDTEAKIEKRVEQHLEYIVPAILEIVFSTVYSKNLLNVTLVINKIDLLRDVVAMGCIPGVSLGNVDDYVRNLFKKVEHNVRDACDRASTSDSHTINFQVVVVSAVTGQGVAKLFNEIVRQHAIQGSNSTAPRRTARRRRRAAASR
ncbi:MAG: hypothetical protein HC910_01145 [Spirulinaceae cyanobacterium SM2_1_0]|nr:hypothetical protein [Spirulinaceae cyanobacterium SM2_1_0]